MSELKKCPFCGGEATLVHGLCELDNYVVCQKCLSRTKVFNTKESAIKTWNTRKPVERILERLESLCEIAMRNSERSAELGEAYEKHMILHGAKGGAYETAIKIIKEEVGQIEEVHN